MNERQPKVGIGVILIKDKKVLLGKRKSPHGKGTWCFPGGRLEYGENFEDCAKREVFEETGLNINSIRFLTATNDIFKEQNEHYITIFMVSKDFSGEPALKEPDKSEFWRWFLWDNLPSPLFLPIINLLDQGIDPFIDENQNT